MPPLEQGVHAASGGGHLCRHWSEAFMPTRSPATLLCIRHTRCADRPHLPFDQPPLKHVGKGGLQSLLIRIKNPLVTRL